jgi:hypothetical protein
MHIQPSRTAQSERQELRMKEARIERDTEKQRLERLLAAVRRKLQQREAASQN